MPTKVSGPPCCDFILACARSLNDVRNSLVHRRETPTPEVSPPGLFKKGRSSC
jgi:hypothetical protein